MPYQVGVAVAGGLNMWSTVVECLLQRDARNVVVAVDLANCFNDVDRDALLVDEWPDAETSAVTAGSGRLED